MIWYVHKVEGAIVSAHSQPQAGYAEEALDDELDVDLQAVLEAARNPVPQTASSGDFIHALYDLEWLQAVEAAVIQVDGLAEKLWNRASVFERHHPLVIQIATAIGKNSADLDDLFRKAATYS